MSDGDLPRRKRSLRREVVARLRALAPGELAERGRRALERLAAAEEYRKAGGVLLYSSMPDEIDTSGLIDAALAEGKRVFLPVCDPARDEMSALRVTDRGADLSPGRFGILEPRADLAPAAPGEIEFVLVPGRAFDGQCRRLGRGRGFYDRFLGEVTPETAFAAAAALDLQVFAEVPAGEHDRPVDLVVTETRTIRAERS
ncbi:MAG: 5-formyltetrahydrofolate cyclo-ligase [Planctomycetota bacterium]|jgi:5-formyltetrahydrofolate cyclo-ligase